MPAIGPKLNGTAPRDALDKALGAAQAVADAARAQAEAAHKPPAAPEPPRPS